MLESLVHRNHHFVIQLKMELLNQYARLNRFNLTTVNSLQSQLLALFSQGPHYSKQSENNQEDKNTAARSLLKSLTDLI